MRKFKLVVPSFLALIFCMLLIAGSTFALFTSQAEASIAVTSGKVKVDAALAKPTLYSADSTLTSGDLAGTIEEGNFAGTYYFKAQTGNQFANGGSAAVANGNELTLTNMTPGDKVVTALNITNSSNVNIKYRVRLVASYSLNNVDYSQALAAGMKVTLGNTTKSGLVNYQSAWIDLDLGSNGQSVSPLALDLSFELPLGLGNAYQNGGVSYKITVEAVQGNAQTSGEEKFETVDFIPEATSEAVELVYDTATTLAATTDYVVDTTATQENKLNIIASVPANAAFENGQEQAVVATSIELRVSDVYVSNDTETNETSFAADIKLVNQDEEEIHQVSEPVTVTVYVGKGYNNVTVKHNGTAISGSNYNSTIGYVTFTTESFSEFEFVAEFYAAKVGNVKYGNLLDAVAAALESNGTVVLLSDCKVSFESNAITVAANKSLTIDLNGKVINALNTANNSGAALLVNRGTLHLLDSSATQHGIGNGKITLLAQNPDIQDIPSYASNLISNYANLTISGGIYENQTDGYAAYALDNYSGANTVINGGKFIQNNEYAYAVRMFPNSTTVDNKLVFNDGIVEGGYALWLQYTNANANMATLEINGGTFNARDGFAVYAGYGTRNATNVRIKITGGVINGTGAVFGADTYDDNYLSISGGTFNGLLAVCGKKVTLGEEAPINYLEEGYELIDNQDGTYSVVAVQTE